MFYLFDQKEWTKEMENVKLNDFRRKEESIKM